MNATQLATLKAAIIADTNLAAFITANDDVSIAAYYNTAASPSVSIWNPNISVQELNTAIVWADFVGLTVQQQQAYLAMIAPGFIDATSTNIRAGFVSVFGAPASSATTTNLLAIAERNATRFEALFTTNGVCELYGSVVTHDDIAKVVRNADGTRSW